MRNDPSKSIPMTGSNAALWVAWHKSLKRYFSKDEANTWFLKFWEVRGGEDTDANMNSLRSYMESQGVELKTDWRGDLTDAATDARDDAKAFIKGVLIVGAIVLGAILIAFLWYMYHAGKQQTPIGQMAIDGASVLPSGKAIKGVQATKLLSA